MIATLGQLVKLLKWLKASANLNFQTRGIPFEEITALENLSEQVLAKLSYQKNYLNY
jgi:hypothetical protein